MKNEPSMLWVSSRPVSNKLHVWVSSERTGTLGKNLPCPAAENQGNQRPAEHERLL